MIQVYELETANGSEDRVIQIDVDDEAPRENRKDIESFTMTVRVKDVYGVSSRYDTINERYNIYLYTSNAVIHLGEFQDMEESLKLERTIFPNREWKRVA